MMVMITVTTDDDVNLMVISNFCAMYNGDDDDVQRSPPNPAPAGLSDARRCDDGDGPENRFVIMMVIYMFYEND